MLILKILLLTISFSSLIINILIYKLYKEMYLYRQSMFACTEEYDESFCDMLINTEESIEEPEYTYDNPPKSVNNLFDVDAYRKRMDAMKREQEQDGLYDIKDEGVIVNDIYFTGVEEPED